MLELISVAIILIIIYIVLRCCNNSSTSSIESYAPIKPSRANRARSPIRSAARNKGIRVNGNHNKVIYNKNSYNRYPAEPSVDTPTYYDARPWRYWTNFVYPASYQNYPTSYPSSYYPYGYYPMAYGLAGDGYYSDPYDYTAGIYPDGGVCWARIGIEDAFGPYTAGVMGKQAWLDWGGRNGFDKVALNSQSVTNDHAIASYVGMCRPEQQIAPGSPYIMYNSTPQYY